MANNLDLKAAIQAVIKANGNNEITGTILQNALLSIINQIGAASGFKGIATPSTNPGTSDANIFYIASANGTYPNFNGIQLTNEVAVLSNASGTWTKLTTGAANTSSVLNFLMPTSEIPKALEAILSFRLEPTADLQPGKTYSIKFFYNEPTRSLIQIVDNDGRIITQNWLPTSNLVGINTISLLNTSNTYGVGGKPFATIVVDASKMPTTQATGTFNALLNISGASTNFMGISYLIPGGTISCTTSGYNVTLIIPNSTRVIAPGFTTIVDTGVTLTKEMTTPSYLVYDRYEKVFKFVEVTAAYDYRNYIYLGIFNGFSQRQQLNSGNFNVNGVAQTWSNTSITEAMVVNTQAVPKNYGPWKNPTNSTFDFNAVLRLEAIAGDHTLLYEADGVTPLRLFVTFMRFRKFDGNSVATNIFQISKMVDGNVGVNNVTIATLGSATPEDLSSKPIYNFTVLGTGAYSSLKFSVIVDLAKIPSSIQNSSSLGGSLELDTFKFIEQLKSIKQIGAVPPLQGKRIVCFGDSVTEFGDYPNRIAQASGATVFKIGFGGCRMGARASTSQVSNAYSEMAMYKVSETVASGDFTNMEAAAEYLKLNQSDDNTATVALLKSIDFNTIDYVTIFYGTNDFTGNDATLGEDVFGVDPLTIKGATNVSLKNLLEAYPHLKVLVLTPTHRFIDAGLTQDSDFYTNTLGLKLIQVCDAIKETAHANHVEVLDLYRESGLNKYNHTLYFADGVHPNSAGYRYLGEKIAAKLISMFKLIP